MNLAFVCGLSDKKLSQKLFPLQAMQNVDVIHLYRRKPYRGNKIYWMGIPAWAGKSAFVGDLLRFILLLVNGWRYDVFIGCHQSFHGLIVFICALIWRKPVIQVVIAEVDWVYKKPLLKLALFSADVCAVRGPIAYKRLKELGYKGRIEILQNPLKLPEKSVYDNLFEKCYDLIAVGDYARAKAYPWMMEVIAGIKKQQPDIKVAIVGRGPYQKKIGSLLSMYKLNNNVEFLGWQDESRLATSYCKSRGLLLTSSTEGLPMVVIEAMSYKLPVFVTAVGELKWLIEDGVEGRIVPYGATAAMADAVSNAFADPELLSNMGNNGYQKILSLGPDFSPERIGKVWSGVLEYVLGKKNI